MNTTAITLKAFKEVLELVGENITIRRVASAITTVSVNTTSSEFREFAEYAATELHSIEDAHNLIEEIEAEIDQLEIETSTGRRYGQNEVDDEYIEETLFVDHDHGQAKIGDLMKALFN